MPLLGLPPLNAPIKSLERLWLDTVCIYDQFNDNVMADTDWDAMAKALNERKAEWSPYFKHALGADKWEAWDVGTTGAGVDWTQGIPLLVYNWIKALDGDYQTLHTRHQSLYL